jgi:hypothetical protein
MDKDSHLSRLAQKRTTQEAEPRTSMGTERQLTGVELELELRFANGHEAQALPWGQFMGWQLKSGGEWHELTILFTGRMVKVDGKNLDKATGMIRDGRLGYFQELNSAELAVAVKEDDGKPIVKSIDIWPKFEDLVMQLREGSDHV